MNSFSPELQAAIQGYQNPTNNQGPGSIPLFGEQEQQPGGGQPDDGSGLGIGNMVMPRTRHAGLWP